MPISNIAGNNWLILIAIICYLLGSFPSAYFVTKRISGKDIRFEGSRNVGAMNSYRLIRAEKSTKLATMGLGLVLVGDGGKGMLAIFVARWLGFLEYNLAIALIVGSFFVVLGHNYPFFFKFREGGKGIASLAGILLALNRLSFLIWGGTVILAIILAQYLLIAKINWGKFSEVFSVIGSQVVGRVGGIVASLVPLYFFNPGLFLPIVAATILTLIKHIERVKAYIGELPNHNLLKMLTRVERE